MVAVEVGDVGDQSRSQRTTPRGGSAISPSGIGNVPHPEDCSHASTVQRVTTRTPPASSDVASQSPQTPYAT